MRNLIAWIIFALGIPLTVGAQVETLVVGRDGLDWRASSEDLLGLDDSISVGSLQPLELDPLVNIVVGLRTDHNID